MKVKELIAILQGCETDAGTWLDGEPKDIDYILPDEEFREDSDTVYLEG